MTIPEFDPTRRAALSELLADTVTSTTAGGRRPPRWAGVTAFAIAGILTGGAVSAAAATFRVDDPSDQPPAGYPALQNDPAAGLRGVPAPSGVAPGAPIISLLGTVESVQITAEGAAPLSPTKGDHTAAIELAPPAGATHLRVTFSCLTPGTTSWGLDPGGNNPATTCTSSDVLPSSGWYDFILDGPGSLYIDAEPGASSIVSLQYVAQIETAWGVNADGETYGTAAKPGAGDPDLILVVGTTSSGEQIEGYARGSDMQRTMPSSREEALAQQEEWERLYPDGRTIPVYESDGRTQIGVFTAG